MKKLFVVSSILIMIIGFLSFGTPTGIEKTATSLNDSLKQDRAKFIALINESIKGKEQMAVDSVFKNLKVLGGFEAENLVFAMDAWSRGLGVSCGHCHNTDNFADDTPTGASVWPNWRKCLVSRMLAGFPSQSIN